MQLSHRILGKSVVEGIAARAAAPLLTIGKDTFYRRDLANIGCFNFLAASNLSAVISALQPKDTKDVYDNVPPTALVLPHIGSISLAVLGAAFEKRGLGGDQPLESWYAKHRPKEATTEYLTFSSMKHAEAKREIGEARAKKQRKDIAHGRRDKAQRIRGERHLKRHAGVKTNGS